MILDDGFCLRGPNHHRVENFRPQNCNASHHRHHDDQCFPRPQRATVRLTWPTVGRCCHCAGWQQQLFLKLPNRWFSLLLSLLLFYRSHCGEDAVYLPFTSKCFPRGKLSVFTFVSDACCCFDNFHSISPFRAPLTEMTRLLLVVVFWCTQSNLFISFHFLAAITFFFGFWQIIIT